MYCSFRGSIQKKVLGMVDRVFLLGVLNLGNFLMSLMLFVVGHGSFPRNSGLSGAGSI